MNIGESSQRKIRACLWLLELAMFIPLISIIVMDALFDASSHPDLDSTASILAKISIGAFVSISIATPFLWRIKKQLGIVGLSSVIIFLVVVMIPQGM